MLFSIAFLRVIIRFGIWLDFGLVLGKDLSSG